MSPSCPENPRDLAQRALSIGLMLLFAATFAACQPAPGTPLPTTPGEDQGTPTATLHTPITPGGAPTTARTPTPSPTPPPALIPGGRVVQGGLSRVHRVDPRAGDLNPVEQEMADLLFESLLVPSPLDGRPEPALAEEWAFSPDGLEVTFRLREGVRWHDGAPLTAEDVVQALETARDPDGGGTLWPLLKPVLSVEALGPREVRATFREPDCWAFWTLGQVPLVRWDAEGRPVGTGPFRWAGQETDGRVLLEAFRAYWGPAPYLDGWAYQPFPDAASLEQALGAGVVDLALWPEKDVPAVWNPASGYALLPLPGETYFVLVFNTRQPPLRDAAGRRALAGLVDRAALLQEVGGKGLVLDTPLPSGHWALGTFRRTEPVSPPEAVQKALSPAGWADADGDGWLDYRGKPRVLAVEANAENPWRIEIAQGVAAQLRAAGVPAELRAVEWGVLLSDLVSHTFDLAVLDLPFHTEPAACTLWREDTGRKREPFNWPGLADEDLDHLGTLLEAARDVPGCRPEERAAQYASVWAWLDEERPFQVLLSPARWLVVDPALKGLVASPFRPWYWNLNRWYWTAETGS